jgi:hypothetical protein
MVETRPILGKNRLPAPSSRFCPASRPNTGVSPGHQGQVRPKLNFRLARTEWLGSV